MWRWSGIVGATGAMEKDNHEGGRRKGVKNEVLR